MSGSEECKEIERLIPDFISRKLNYRLLKRFLAHIEECHDCREELVIQFLVAEGMARLEEGSAFDLKWELDRRREEAVRRLKLHESFLRAGFVLELIAMAGFLLLVMWIILS